MIRILVIGRAAPRRADDIDASTSQHVDLEVARRPAAGIRRFESTPADIVVVTDDQPARVETVAEALRDRPLGELVPVLALAQRPEDVDEAIDRLDLADWLAVDTPPSALVERLEDALEASLTDPGSESPVPDSNSEPVAPDTASPDGSASYLDGDVVLEPMDEPDGPARVDRQAVFGDSSSPEDADDTGPTADELDRKLETVRHEDYYAILEVRRGADPQTVREAFHRLYHRWDPDRIRFDLVRERRDDIDEIRDALEDAFAVLGDPELSRRYLDHTTR